ncbi:MAG: hypothetical protein OXH32_07100 [Acidobacteria bacterium]|nr:hypothetical protein [Acidobacteriota bacterium]MXZ40104.1 hypothetical protein [Holophagales bacterium]MYF04431.1 hypothetical protein [Holophagales bacterium]MYJ26716.1 hypothetical protein [Holophagales bacterium]
MNRAADRLLPLAAAGRLYPSVIVSGGTPAERRNYAFEIGRALLCERVQEERPCGQCRHCRRVDPDRYASEARAKEKFEKRRRKAGDGSDVGVRQSHPDFMLLERPPGARDIGVDLVRPVVRSAQMSPFEARGQVYVIHEADTLNPYGSNVLLKTLEEPVGTTPRHFLLLTHSAQELLPTLRSRSLTVYLGGQSAGTDGDLIAKLTADWRRRPDNDGFALWISGLADGLVAVGGKDLEDVRARHGWTRITAAVVDVAGALDDRSDRAAALALATDLLDAHRLRERYIQPRRIIEGLAARRLRRDRPETGFESSVNVLMGPP